ncbi:hypothetical protein [Yinghuangia seranimata]|uniref:hypothetical protein n=1 Tax=Yinghuangia seranimata TaxID=408067 RepID=UPI00248C96E0|nr:hypothetical protein [Yinghuangia seranimata]MDI2129141.1 hypothetical protein [Yinghuangia seranimata]
MPTTQPTPPASPGEPGGPAAPYASPRPAGTRPGQPYTPALTPASGAAPAENLGPTPRRSPAKVRAHFYSQPLIVLALIVGFVLVAAVYLIGLLGNVVNPGGGGGSKGVNRTSSNSLWMSRRRLRHELRGTDAEWRAWADSHLRAAIAKVEATDAKRRAKADPSKPPLPPPSVCLVAADRRTLTAADVDALVRPLGWYVEVEHRDRQIWVTRNDA